MADQSPKQLLSALLTRGQLKPKEREAFEDMWDAIHRYGKLSRKQRSWIESVYYKQKLDRASNSKRSPRVGYINHAKVKDMVLVTNLNQVQDLFPEIRPGTKQYQKIKTFFLNGGEVLKIKPFERKTHGHQAQ